MTRNRILWAGIIILTIFVLVSCGEPNRLTSGTVIDKRYDDPDDTYHPPVHHPGTTRCTGTGTSRVCTYQPGYTQPGYWTHDGPHWHLHIEGTDGDGKTRREWHEVTEAVYDRLRIGMTWEK